MNLDQNPKRTDYEIDKNRTVKNEPLQCTIWKIPGKLTKRNVNDTRNNKCNQGKRKNNVEKYKVEILYRTKANHEKNNSSNKICVDKGANEEKREKYIWNKTKPNLITHNIYSRKIWKL